MSQISQRKSKTKQESISDEQLLDETIKSNDICSHATCDKSIRVIRLDCQLCRQFFCTSHVLPEIHGCGEAARKAASAPVKKAPNPERMKQLEKKMTKKLDKMANERKKKRK